MICYSEDVDSKVKKKKKQVVHLPDQQSSIDVLLEEIFEREKLTELTRESCSSKNVETDRKKTEEMRSKALERLGETKRKANEDFERKAKRQQRSRADVTEFPREKSKRSLRSVKGSSL